MAEVINMNNENIGNTEDIKKIPVAEFIKKYTRLTSEKTKEMYLKSVIAGDDFYVPYVTKIVYANQIIEAANFNKDGIYYNTPKQYQMYMSVLLSLYTCLEIDGQSFNEIFDSLESIGVFDKMMDLMPKDKTKFDVVFNMVRDNFDQNMGKININIDEIVSAVKIGIVQGVDAVLEAAKGLFDNEEVMKVLSQYISIKE